MYESFKCVCPKCKSDDLAVVAATITATGERLDMKSPLSADGFEVPVSEDVNASTEDELVRCNGCGHEFDLADITL